MKHNTDYLQLFKIFPVNYSAHCLLSVRVVFKLHFFIEHAIEKSVCPQQTALTLSNTLATFIDDIPIIETKPHRKIDVLTRHTSARNIFIFLPSRNPNHRNGWPESAEKIEDK